MEIRAATADDARSVTELLNQLGYPNPESDIRRKIEQLTDHPDALVVVAIDMSVPVGLMALHFIPQLALAGDFCRITYFCVSDAARSRGIGNMLETWAEGVARARGCDRMEVHCHCRRERAHAFYLRQGYRESPKYLLKLLRAD